MTTKKNTCRCGYRYPWSRTDTDTAEDAADRQAVLATLGGRCPACFLGDRETPPPYARGQAERDLMLAQLARMQRRPSQLYRTTARQATG